MKIHTPIFTIGLLVFVTPFLGLTSIMEMIIIPAFGIAIMLISSTIRPLKDSGLEMSEEDIEDVDTENDKEVDVEEVEISIEETIEINDVEQDGEADEETEADSDDEENKEI